MVRASRDDRRGSHAPTQALLGHWQTRGCAIFYSEVSTQNQQLPPPLQFSVCCEHTSRAQTALTIYLWMTGRLLSPKQSSPSRVSPVVDVCLLIYPWLVSMAIFLPLDGSLQRATNTWQKYQIFTSKLLKCDCVQYNRNDNVANIGQKLIIEQTLGFVE